MQAMRAGMVTMQAAEQIFQANGGYSNLIWLDYPDRPLIFLIHHTGYWQGWPDTWDGKPILGANGAERGFACHLLRLYDAGWNINEFIGFAIHPEVSYEAQVKELVGAEMEWIDPNGIGWRISDSYDRVLYLNARGMTWSVEQWPD